MRIENNFTKNKIKYIYNDCTMIVTSLLQWKEQGLTFCGRSSKLEENMLINTIKYCEKAVALPTGTFKIKIEQKVVIKV